MNMDNIPADDETDSNADTHSNMEVYKLYERCLSALPDSYRRHSEAGPMLTSGTAIQATDTVSIQEALMIMGYWRHEWAAVRKEWLAAGQSGGMELALLRYAPPRLKTLEQGVAKAISQLCKSSPLTDRGIEQLSDILSAIVSSGVGQLYKYLPRGNYENTRSLHIMLSTVIAIKEGDVLMPITKTLFEAMEMAAETIKTHKSKESPRAVPPVAKVNAPPVQVPVITDFDDSIIPQPVSKISSQVLTQVRASRARAIKAAAAVESKGA